MKVRFISLLFSPLIVIILLVIWLVLIPQATHAIQTKMNILYTAPQGDCGEAAPCYADLQQAVQAANPGDEIKVAAGVFTQTYSFTSPDFYLGKDIITQVAYITKPLTIVGGFTITNWIDPEPLKNPTILNAQSKGRVIFINGAAPIVLEGLDITGGTADSYSISGDHDLVGGGVFAISATVSISGSRILRNHSGDYGGGLYASDSDLKMINTDITQNSATFEGAGVYADSSQLYLENCDISENQTTVRGGEAGGISINGGVLELKNCIVQNNTAFEKAGGILAKNSGVTISNSIIQNQTATTGGGLVLLHSHSQILSSTIRNNNAFWYYGGGSGAGVFISGGSLTIIGSDIIGNTGCSLYYGSGYEYDCSGGGIMSIGGDLTLERNRIMGNTAVKGGALASFGETTLLANNNVFLDNHSSGLYLAGTNAKFIHNTLARNPAANGSIQIASASSVSMTNTIFSDNEIGILTSENSTTTLESVLWFANTANITGTGQITVTNAYTGTPAFACDGYHLTAPSTAIDRGISTEITIDVDLDPRPLVFAPDLGADEFGGFVPDCRFTFLLMIFR